MAKDEARIGQPASGQATAPAHVPADSARQQHLRGLAEGVIRARLDAGLSQRELARRMGVSNATVSRIESGQDSRWSSLRRILDCLPHVQQAQLLPAGTPAPPESSPAAWSAYRDLFGFEAGRAWSRLEVDDAGNRISVLEVGPIRAVRGDLADDGVRTALMRAVCLASRPVLLSVTAMPSDLRGGTRRVEEADAVHEFTFDGHAPSFTYRRRMTIAAEPAAERGRPAHALEGSAQDILYPIRILLIEVQLPESRWPMTGRARAWLPAGTGEPQDSELARYLHPHGLPIDVDEHGRCLRMTVTQPLVGVAYALTWQRAASERPALRLTTARGKPRSVVGSAADVGRTLRKERLRLGESLRETAARMGLSWVTVREAERGPARASTLMAYLAAFPHLCPQDLLPGLPHDEPMTGALLWEYSRQIFGFWAEDLVKTLRIDSQSGCRTKIATKSMQALRHDGDALTLRLGLQRAALSNQPVILEKLSASRMGVRVQRVDQVGGRDVHQFTFEHDGLAGGIHYTRRFARRQVFHMNELTARRLLSGPPPYVEGTSITVLHPVRRLRLSVKFPRGYWPAEVFFHAWPDVHVPDPMVPELNCLDFFIHSTVANRGAGEASLSVEMPLVGFKHAISWRLP